MTHKPRMTDHSDLHLQGDDLYTPASHIRVTSFPGHLSYMYLDKLYICGFTGVVTYIHTTHLALSKPYLKLTENVLT